MRALLAALLMVPTLFGCSSPEEEVVSWTCTIAADETPDYAQQLGCQADFTALAAVPLDTSLPGARTVKVLVDQLGGDALYFQNTTTYPIHHKFASAHLSGSGKPVVPQLSQFNQTEYYSPSRRFILGAVTYYADPKVWAFEISPYDTASAEMITKAYNALVRSTYFGQQLRFHPTSQAVEQAAKKLPASVKTVSTEELYADTNYQALNLGTCVGRLRFMTASQLSTEYVSYRDIVVLDRVPNDISVVLGIITAEFQTPLSHINVLSQNRGTPNMALKGADTDKDLLAHKDSWVELDVNANDYSVKAASQAEADAWWDNNKPTAVQVPKLDLSVTDLRDADKLLDTQLTLGEALSKAIPAFGGKGSHYGGIATIGAAVPTPKAFVIPVYYYRQFMQQNGLDAHVKKMLANKSFVDSPAVRDKQLEQLRADMLVAPVDASFTALLLAKLKAEYPGLRMRFRSSTNAEDLDGFTGAGLYTSLSGDPADSTKSVLDAVRGVWASVWYFRAFEERSYRSIGHETVGMALLVHRSFPDEEANGVALTANPYDASGLEPGFYINVQKGGSSVVKPEVGVTTDQFVYHYSMPGQPVVFISNSNLVPTGQTVLTTAQTYKLGQALDAIHTHFFKTYGKADGSATADPSAWYAMDVEFKFDGLPGEEPALYVKQARPHPGRGQ